MISYDIPCNSLGLNLMSGDVMGDSARQLWWAAETLWDARTGVPSCDPIRGAKRIHFGVFFFFLRMFHILTDWTDSEKYLIYLALWLDIEWYSWRVFGSKLFLDQSYSLDISKSTVFFIIHIWIYIYIWYIQILYDIVYDIKFADFADLNGPGRTGLGERWAGTWEIRWKGGLLLWRFVDFER